MFGCQNYKAAVNSGTTLALSLATFGHEAHAVAAGDRWAVVNQNGTLARGKGATASAYAYPGVLGAYRVVFDKNVSQCLYLATLGTEYPSTPASGEIAVAPDVADVHVVTRTSAGVATNRPFHLPIGC